jgi:hypothetical protein
MGNSQPTKFQSNFRICSGESTRMVTGLSRKKNCKKSPNHASGLKEPIAAREDHLRSPDFVDFVVDQKAATSDHLKVLVVDQKVAEVRAKGAVAQARDPKDFVVRTGDRKASEVPVEDQEDLAGQAVDANDSSIGCSNWTPIKMASCHAKNWSRYPNPHSVDSAVGVKETDAKEADVRLAPRDQNSGWHRAARGVTNLAVVSVGHADLRTGWHVPGPIACSQKRRTRQVQPRELAPRLSRGVAAPRADCRYVPLAERDVRRQQILRTSRPFRFIADVRERLEW